MLAGLFKWGFVSYSAMFHLICLIVFIFVDSHPTNLPPPPHAPIMHSNVIGDPRMQLVQSPIAIPIINAGPSMPVSVPSMPVVPAGAVLSKPPLVPGASADVQMRKLIRQQNCQFCFVLHL